MCELFPKKDKYALGLTCERLVIATIELILEASYTPREQKRVVLQKLNKTFENLKIFIRIGKELNIIALKPYLALEHALQDIGKDLGGWMNYIERQTPREQRGVVRNMGHSPRATSAPE